MAKSKGVVVTDAGTERGQVRVTDPQSQRTVVVPNTATDIRQAAVTVTQGEPQD